MKKGVALFGFLTLVFFSFSFISGSPAFIESASGSYSYTNEDNGLSLNGFADFQLDHKTGLNGEGRIETFYSSGYGFDGFIYYYKKVETINCNSGNCVDRVEYDCLYRIDEESNNIPGGCIEIPAEEIELGNIDSSLQKTQFTPINTNNLVSGDVGSFVAGLCEVSKDIESYPLIRSYSNQTDSYGRFTSWGGEVHMNMTYWELQKPLKSGSDFNCNWNINSYYPIDSDWDGFSSEGGAFGPFDCYDNVGTSLDSDFDCQNYVDDVIYNLGKQEKEKRPLSKYSSMDSNNNGIEDYSGCGFLTKPASIYNWSNALKEISPVGLDIRNNVDNNCLGSCFGNGSVVCRVGNGVGFQSPDSPLGASSNDCSNGQGLGGFMNDFCVMIDEGFGSNSNYYPRILNVYSDEEIISTEDKLVFSQKEIVSSEDAVDNNIILSPKEKEYRVKVQESEVYVFHPAGGWQSAPYFMSFFDPYEISDIRNPLGFSKNAVCGKYKIYTFLSKDFDEEVYLIPKGESFELSTKKDTGGIPLDFRFGKASQNYVVPIDDSCLPKKESEVSTRPTVGWPKQFVDTIYGGLDYDKFLEIAGDVPLKSWGFESSGNEINTYNSVFIDSCSDGLDNDGSENLYDVYPYKSYLPNARHAVYSNIKGEDSIFETKGSDFQVPLIDIDDPDCKFELDVEPDTRLSYVGLEYKKSPFTQEPYCLDEDYDGFCGCKMDVVSETKCTDDSGCSYPEEACGYKNLDSGEGICVKCLKWITTKTVSSGTVYSGGLDKTQVYCSAYEPKYVCNETKTLQTNGLSLQFPDCDDDVSDDSYQYKYNNPGLTFFPFAKISKSEGWSDVFSKQPYSSFFVHPFSPVTIESCKYNQWDFNCNKNLEDGYAFNLLAYKGNTPFDFDTSTGLELVNRYGNGYSFSDYVCYEPPIEVSGVIKTVGKMAVYGLLLSNPYTGVPVVIAQATIGGYNIGDAYTSYYHGMISWEEAYPKMISGALEVSFAMLAGVQLGGNPEIRVDKDGITLTRNPLDKTQRAWSNSLKEPVQPTKGGIKTDLTSVSEGAGCFLEGTKVLMADKSYKNIEDIKKGDVVMGYDLEKNKSVETEISAWFERPEDSYIIIEY